ncbi:MAG: electron transport complex subunit RsxC, partial [Gammaproteobacteria bacterium]
TAGKLATSADADVHTLILNGTECEPYITCDEILMREHAKRILEGARIMMRAIGATRTIVGIESDMPEARVAVWDAIEADGLDDVLVSIVTAKYPAGGERQLIQLITGEEVPEGALPSDIGFVCQNVGTAAAVADLFRDGRPLISRVITLTGRGIGEPMNIDARLGTLISDLFEIAGGVSEDARRLVMGGPMMGIAVATSDLPVTKATNCLIAMTPREISPTRREMPCIRCGECSQVCPAQLLPQELLNAGRRHDMGALVELGLNACIECGCCDYVCPSQILLTDRFITAKRELHDYGVATTRATHARDRLEARAARLAQEREHREDELARQTRQAGEPETLDEIMARVDAAEDRGREAE